jgi:hypothetical protein
MQEMKKPIQVWIKYNNGGWQCVFDTDSPPLAREYAQNRISFSSSMERVEVRDDFGRAVLETIFDRSWE